jgi:hypothetical protein
MPALNATGTPGFIHRRPRVNHQRHGPASSVCHGQGSAPVRDVDKCDPCGLGRISPICAKRLPESQSRRPLYSVEPTNDALTSTTVFPRFERNSSAICRATWSVEPAGAARAGQGFCVDDHRFFPKKRRVRSQACCAQTASYCVTPMRPGPCAVSLAKPWYAR